MTTITQFVAETDGRGDIACVWRKGPMDRAARPVTVAGKYLSELNNAEFFGAAPEAIRHWMQRHS